MPNRPPISALGAFIKALHESEIPFILIGMMAAIRQGAPLMTIDYDFWVKLPEQQYVRILAIIQRLGGTIRARTLYELKDGTQVNVVFQPDGLRSFAVEYKQCHPTRLEGQPVRMLPLARIIASKRAAGRDKDVIALPVLERTLRLSKQLKRRGPGKRKRPLN